MKITLPLSIIIPRKTKEDKVFVLNLNIYRNAHHMVLNKAKEMYGDCVRRSVGPVETIKLDPPPYLFTYTIFAENNRKFDLGNVCPILQKFTDDSLIEAGVIEDDCYRVIPAINYRFGGVDKVNPRVELEIEHYWED